MKMLSATDLAIAAAIQNGSLALRPHFNERIGRGYYAIDDASGTIEVALTSDEAHQRIGEIACRMFECGPALQLSLAKDGRRNRD
jgi:hypothetical protein